MRSDRNVAASHSIVSCRVNAAQPSGNPASARRQIPRCASFKFLPTRPHPPSRHSARAPRPCLPLLLARPRFPPLSCTPAHPSSRSADAIAFALSEFPRISARPVPAPRTTPSKSAPARSPLPHARTPRPVPLAPPLPRSACPCTSAWPSGAKSS